MSDSRTRTWFALFVLVVFCVGLAGGALIGRAVMRRAPIERGFDRGPREFGPGGPGPRRGGGPPPRRDQRLRVWQPPAHDPRAPACAMYVQLCAGVSARDDEVRCIEHRVRVRSKHGKLNPRARSVALRESVLTSSRKIRTHSARELLGAALLPLRRGRRAYRDRAGLEVWYGPRRADPGAAPRAGQRGQRPSTPRRG